MALTRHEQHLGCVCGHQARPQGRGPHPDRDGLNGAAPPGVKYRCRWLAVGPHHHLAGAPFANLQWDEGRELDLTRVLWVPTNFT
jgi:hypothetical protein